MGPFGGPQRPGHPLRGVLPGTFARMHSSSTHRHWDGSPVQHHQRRSLRIDPDSPTRLLRCAQRDRCRECGNPVEWYHRVADRPVRLHPEELPVADVPADYRWHVSSGLAHPAGDGNAWCRLAHAAVCPARDAGATSVPALTRLRRVLAVNTRRLRDTGVFTPCAPSDRSSQQPDDSCRPARPIVQLLYRRYLAVRPVDDIQCVDQTRQRSRCTNRVQVPEGLAGIECLSVGRSTRLGLMFALITRCTSTRWWLR